MVRQVSAALFDLAAAMHRLKVPLWRRPTSVQPLRELEELLSPLRLPTELVTFWSEVDADTLLVNPYPRFQNPAWAITSWTMSRDDFAEAQPLALIDVAYESHGVMSVELGVADRPGGALYAWWVDDIGIYRCFDGLGDWIAEIAALLNADIYRSMERPGDPVSFFVPTELEWSPDPSSPGHYHLPRGVKMIKSFEGLETWPTYWQQVNRERGRLA